MTEKLAKEFEKIRASLIKSKKIILADIDKIDEKYRKLAQEEKKSLTENLSVLNGQLKYYDSMFVSNEGEMKEVEEEPEEAEEEEKEEEEETVKDTLFPDNNEEEEEKPAEVDEETEGPDIVSAPDEPLFTAEHNDSPVAEPDEESEEKEEEEEEWHEVSNEDDPNPEAEGWPSMPEEWK